LIDAEAGAASSGDTGRHSLGAWPAILKFLEAGGSFLYVGGEPFTRPVTGAPGARRAEPRTVAYLKALRLNQAYRIEAGGCAIQRVGAADTRVLPSPAWIAALEPRFAETPLVADEEGSPGAREATLHALACASPGRRSALPGRRRRCARSIACRPLRRWALDVLARIGAADLRRMDLAARRGRAARSASASIRRSAASRASSRDRAARTARARPTP
jgi:hypothetical protein